MNVEAFTLEDYIVMVSKLRGGHVVWCRVQYILHAAFGVNKMIAD